MAAGDSCPMRVPQISHGRNFGWLVCIPPASYAARSGCSYDQNNQYGADQSSYGYGNYGGALFRLYIPALRLPHSLQARSTRPASRTLQITRTSTAEHGAPHVRLRRRRGTRGVERQGACVQLLRGTDFACLCVSACCRAGGRGVGGGRGGCCQSVTPENQLDDVAHICLWAHARAV